MNATKHDMMHPCLIYGLRNQRLICTDFVRSASTDYVIASNRRRRGIAIGMLLVPTYRFVQLCISLTTDR
ncbi:hypothetical protein [Roseobacter sp. CCS2]|uniref:hypothetical protein n=1 Tax=Roseobacter sp. CCS2 TaxID=391593 RepID=UPI0000F3C78D|nr:hypothetical protein [Roseobacter sp. CCS2]EBA11539.1 hypothetical protein RCCS2_16461 [Roseobacter sp. CCS2]